jgi:hypothetical protein
MPEVNNSQAKLLEALLNSAHDDEQHFDRLSVTVTQGKCYIR